MSLILRRMPDYSETPPPVDTCLSITDIDAGTIATALRFMAERYAVDWPSFPRKRLERLRDLLQAYVEDLP